MQLVFNVPVSKRPLEDKSTNPLVLVPPIRSNTSQGLTSSRLAVFFRSRFSQSIIDFNMKSVERPRTPPPSRDSRHPVLLRGFGSPPCWVDIACPMIRIDRIVVIFSGSQMCREDGQALTLAAPRCRLRKPQMHSWGLKATRPKLWPEPPKGWPPTGSCRPA